MSTFNKLQNVINNLKKSQEALDDLGFSSESQEIENIIDMLHHEAEVLKENPPIDEAYESVSHWGLHPVERD